MINIGRDYVHVIVRWEFSNPTISLADESSSTMNKFPEASCESINHSVIWWIDRVLIMLALILFIMTVTAQICIYIKNL